VEVPACMQTLECWRERKDSTKITNVVSLVHLSTPPNLPLLGGQLEDRVYG
jgi:hypothetical protein